MTKVATKTFEPVQFGFDIIGPFEGLTDGTYWNGFTNVWVTPETHAKVIAAFDRFVDNESTDDLKALEPVDYGAGPLYSYAGGYATTPWNG